MKTLLLVPVLFSVLALPTQPHVVAPAGDHDWTVDPVHSSVVFRVKHIDAAWFQGTFDKIEGSITLDPAKPESGSVELSIPVDSVDTNNGKRDGHLKSPDFFNGKENPTIEFSSTKIAKKGDSKFEVTGELSMAGKTKTITIPVEMTGTGEMMGAKKSGWMATFPIQRSDFGMTYGLDKNALGDEVTLMICIEAGKA
jgi:polyisoprenoid-binding protein YceI